jgi:hypothetical protein
MALLASKRLKAALFAQVCVLFSLYDSSTHVRTVILVLSRNGAHAASACIFSATQPLASAQFFSVQ